MGMSDALFDSAESIVHYLKPFWRDDYTTEVRDRCIALVHEMDALRVRLDSFTDLTPDQYQEILERVRAERVVEMATDERDTFIDDDIPDSFNRRREGQADDHF